MTEQTITTDDVASVSDVLEGEVKGPDDEHWGDAAREERGAVVIPAPDLAGYERDDSGQLIDSEGEPVKGPDDTHWGDAARAERGA